MVPKKLFLTSGKGFHKNKLQSFELALREAEIHYCNLVRVSSIIPPKCEIISKKEGVSLIKPGEITFCVLSVCETNKADEKIAAGIGLAYSNNKDVFGYIAEGAKHGKECKNISNYVESISVDMLNTISKTDVAECNLYKKSISEICKSKNNGWSTVVAAAVFIM